MLSVIIPAFNEENRLPGCLDKTIEFLSAQQYPSEILVVSDGSTDKTVQICSTYGEKFKKIRIIEYFPNKGKGYAVKTGMLEAKGELRLFMDADYAVPLSTVNSFISKINEGFDIVIGARGLEDTVIVQHQKFPREIAGKVFGKMQKFILDIPFYDTQCGFKLFTKKAAETLFPRLKYECSYFDAEILYIAYKDNFKIKEMPVEWKHDGMTRMPVGPKRTLELLKKLFGLKKLH